MLNKNNERELAYVTTIDDIKPIEGKDRVECAVVGGWRVMVRKGLYSIGDPAVYIEIDSLCPATDERFSFLEKYKYKIKTQKFKGFYSQGLLMSAEELGWNIIGKGQGGDSTIINGLIDNKNIEHYPNTESAFVTKELGIIYYEPEDNKRKASSEVDKYKKMAQRHPKLFQKPFIKWLYKRIWGKKILFLFFGKKKDKTSWPNWVVKTDEERIENMPWVLQEKNEWFATEKIDGTSTTFTMKGRGWKRQFFICSRNVCFDTPAKMAEGAWYDTNVYQEMAIKYDIEKVLSAIMEKYKILDYVTLQGETYGEGIQKRDYSLKEHRFMAFNLIFGYKNGLRRRWNPREMTDILKDYNVPCIPIIDEKYILPDTVEELRNFVDSEPSNVDGKIKEGIVFRSSDGVHSFKCVSPNYLMKYHS